MAPRNDEEPTTSTSQANKDGEEEEDQTDQAERAVQEERQRLLVTDGEPRAGDTEAGRSGEVRVTRAERVKRFLRGRPGEASLTLATFVYAFQNYVAKVVERRVAPMEVVMIRSALAGSVTALTIARQHHRRKWGEISREEAFLGKRSLWPLLTLRATVGAIAFSLTYTSLKYLPGAPLSHPPLWIPISNLSPFATVAVACRRSGGSHGALLPLPDCHIPAFLAGAEGEGRASGFGGGADGMRRDSPGGAAAVPLRRVG